MKGLTQEYISLRERLREIEALLANEVYGTLFFMGNEFFFPRGTEPHIEAQLKLEFVAKAMNGGWTPNWEDGNELKWLPRFKMAPFGFDGTVCGAWAAFSGTGSRLCFKTQKRAELAGKTFTELYKQMMTL